MLTLFLKSSTQPLIAVLAIIDENNVHIIDEISSSEIIDGKSSEMMLVAISNLIDRNNYKLSDIEAIIMASGPGSYTGARVLVSIVKTLAFIRPNIIVYDANMLEVFDHMNRKNMPDSHLGIVYARRNKYYVLGVIDGVIYDSEVVEQTFLESLDRKLISINGKFDEKLTLLELSRSMLDLKIWWKISTEIVNIQQFEPFYLEAVKIG